ncbi:MFS transporter [uncultured Polaribacter sp.]|uniref:MFS transporter n=1 Tax=uncultured Polaribacter sp. TaxID=174711 RepID=UPI0026305ADB|nr:MFS transporter [uncultured Polaribacter sp.]
MKQPKLILLTIVIAQFFCTSLWFAGNGIINDLIASYNLKSTDLAHLTVAVQFGFISGTLSFALFTIADRFSPSKVFFICALLGALFNFGITFHNQTIITLLILRFFTGFFLAGIYPVGMKIATDYFKEGLGTSLGFLVGALVLGTALPHLLKDLFTNFSWQTIVITTSSLSIFGGFLMFLLVPNGPYRKKAKKLNLSVCFDVFKNINFKKAAFGYFGHMWELYAFWAFVPIILEIYSNKQQITNFNIPLLSFLIIGIGSLACVFGSFIAKKYGTKKTAFYILLLSCFCCLISPLFFSIKNEIIFVLFLLFWGMVVIADSPLLSTLVAKNAPEKDRGTALTIVNCLGFSITIISIQLIGYLKMQLSEIYIFVFLAIGPVLGLIALRKSKA